MKLKKEEKKDFVRQLAEELKAAKSIAVVDYQGLEMQDIVSLREAIAEAGGKLKVVKNSLLGLALGRNEEIIREGLKGPVAVVFAEEDEIAPIQKVGILAKEKGLPKFKFGFLDGEVLDASQLATIASLPGRSALYGQVVGAIASPMYGLAYTLQSNLQSLVYVLQQAAQQAGGE